jgi:hypothetical protein
MLMNAEQALQFLMQALVTKPGLSIQECAAVVQAWNAVAEAVKPKEPLKE